ncbi:Hypothetical protein SMAX5B_012110 [Scophthalmus maximus]|uniref:Uncharacterized protein n=1 Tax=Scophthalmus maximus TaxID=52904 RepID=A0A2U9AXJ7_SCOMX|nr:Hypothetical protein SMAX5B_012110 [Scophthalmus maximus]
MRRTVIGRFLGVLVLLSLLCGAVGVTKQNQKARKRNVTDYVTCQGSNLLHRLLLLGVDLQSRFNGVELTATTGKTAALSPTGLQTS